MAVDELTCGQGGSNGLEIITRINELAKLNPRATLVLAGTVNDQTITDDVDMQVAQAFDTARTQRTGFVTDLTNFALTNNSGVNFESVIVTANLNMEFAGELEMAFFIDGTQVGARRMLQGRNTGKPVNISFTSDFYIDTNSSIDIRMRNVDTGSITVKYVSAHFRIDADWNETLQTTTP